MKKLSIMVSTGNLGDNIIEKKSFHEGLKRDLDCLAADAGTADAGPTFLGGDIPHNPLEWEKHDLELLLMACRERRIPMIVGSCSTTGTDRAVDRYADLIRRIASQHNMRPFKMAVIYSQVSKERVLEKLKRQIIEPLGADKPLTPTDLDKTSNITASMGVEQIIHALERNAEVILAGRACDDAVIAAYPIFRGFDKGLSLHLGKALECASLVCWPQKVKESVIGTIYDDCFLLEPMHPDQKATPHSVAAHSMYERENPFIQAVPGGILDTHATEYMAVSDRVCKVSNSKFIPSSDGSYKVKLEGAGPVGHRVYHFVGIRDTFAIQNIDRILTDTRKKVSEIMAPNIDGSDYSLYFHIYGRDGIMQILEIEKEIKGHEVAIVIEVISQDIELAIAVVKCAKFRFFYMDYPGQKNSSGGSVALLTDEPLFPKNPCYQWTIDHLLTLEDPLDPGIFRYKYEIVQ